MQEERKAILAAANAKKQKGNKKKKNEEPPKEEEEVKEEKRAVVTPKRDLDLTDPEEFAEAIAEKWQRPFTFGPIEFSGLNVTDQPFDAEAARD